MSTCAVPTKPARGTDEDVDRAVALGSRFRIWRVEAAMTQADMAHELGRDVRTVKRIEAGEANRLTFDKGAGQQNVSLVEQGQAVWSGRGPTARFVGMGIQLIRDLEDILRKPPMSAPQGIYYPADRDTLADRIARDPSISDDKRRLLLAVLNQPI